MPVPDDLGLAYHGYWAGRDEILSIAQPPPHVPRAVWTAYLRARYSYRVGRPGRWDRLLSALLYLWPRQTELADGSVMYLRAQPGGRVLDVGCGNGAFVHRMRELGWAAEGIDFDPEGVAQARALGLPVRCGSLDEQGYPDCAFDAITLSHVIEHVPRLVAFLRECHRILRPGGRIVLRTPNARAFSHQHFGGAWTPLDPPRHLHVFTPAALRTLLVRAEFSSPRVFTCTRDVPWTYLTSRVVVADGRYLLDRPCLTYPRADRWWGLALQFVEWLCLRVQPGRGEELVAIAHK